jgi:hypothetical protein
MNNVYLIIENKQHSRDIQEWLFSQGTYWGAPPSKTIKETGRKYLYIVDNSIFCHEHDPNNCVLHSCTAISRGRKFKLIKYKKFEEIKINGEVYI